MENIKVTNNNAVVFGSTGLVGNVLIQELLQSAEYEKTIAVTRKKLSVDNPQMEQVLLPDYSKLADLKGLLSAKTWYCCIGTTIKTAGSREAFRDVDFEIPRKIAELAETLSIPEMVVISSMGANAASSNFYLRTKGEMEQKVRENYSGNLKFVRPSLLMGDRNEFRSGEKVAVVFMKIFGWAFIGPLRKYRGISAGDVARAMIKISRLPALKLTYESDELLNIAQKK